MKSGRAVQFPPLASHRQRDRELFLVGHKVRMHVVELRVLASAEWVDSSAFQKKTLVSALLLGCFSDQRQSLCDQMGQFVLWDHGVDTSCT
jgi:hypothetical protein